VWTWSSANGAGQQGIGSSTPPPLLSLKNADLQFSKWNGIGDRILNTAYKSILLSLKNADLELHKWCGAVGHMILHLPANKSLLIPKKCGPAVLQMKWHWGIGFSTLPINQFYYP